MASHLVCRVQDPDSQRPRENLKKTRDFRPISFISKRNPVLPPIVLPRLMNLAPARLLLAILLLPLVGVTAQAAAPAQRPNVLFITMDDMSCDSVGVYGCKLPGTTPNMDKLATQCVRFTYAHSQVGNCMPTRNVIASGRYPHNNHVEGFYEVKNPGYVTYSDLMKAAGYFTGIRGKVSHSTPYTPYPGWDVILDQLPDGTTAHPKNVASYYASAKHGMALAKQAGKPFCLNINISDPHKPFWNEDGRPEVNKPSRVFTASEVPVPGFLPDDPGVREELALYYSSVRRGDDCLGEVLRALRESGEDERTVIIFLSDHGMPLPFAKTQLYFHSTRTPWMFRWPGVTKPGTVDDRHLVSFVDLLPTLMDIVALPKPAGIDGRSFAPLLRGEEQEGRDYVVTEYNENSGGHRDPMRSIITRDFAYIFNPWSNGERMMQTATKGTITYRRMQALAKTDPKAAERLKFFDRRVPEELYNYSTDADALENLVNNPAFRAERDRLTKLLDDWMVRTNDPMLEVFRGRADPKVREAYMKKVEAEAAERNGGKKGKAGKGGKKKGKAVPDLE
jgi:N-sulfoglucosamine sulfohydrolase